MPTLKELKPSSALLVGRVNVGKSTIFNRLLNRYQAITSAEAGTTRDLNRSVAAITAPAKIWLTKPAAIYCNAL
ncbi:MAG: GTPase Der [Parcubacteria group bacterium GW2011_GWE2_43_12]|nr:MAG: GTPase Der [Parcubacteria group bacterium GW2011_GWE2_43_12]